MTDIATPLIRPSGTFSHREKEREDGPRIKK